MNKVKFAAIVAPVMLLVACSHDANTLDDALDGKSNTATVDLAEAYPSAKSLFVVCTSDDAAVSDVFGRDVLDEPEDDENWMIQQRFDSAIITEAYQRDELDVCGGNRDEIREVTNDELTFEQRDGAWALVGERGTDVENLIGSPVD
mgnify:CR=1 FL=1